MYPCLALLRQADSGVNSQGLGVGFPGPPGWLSPMIKPRTGESGLLTEAWPCTLGRVKVSPFPSRSPERWFKAAPHPSPLLPSSSKQPWSWSALLFTPEKEALGAGDRPRVTQLLVVDLGPTAPPLIHQHPSSSSLASKVPERFPVLRPPCRVFCLPPVCFLD